MDQAELSIRLVLQGVADALAVRPPEPFLFVQRADLWSHEFAGRNAHAGQQRVGLHGFPHAGTKVPQHLAVGVGTAQSVFAFLGEQERVPGEPVHVHAPVLGHLQYLAPEGDLLLDRHPFYHLGVPEEFRLEHVLTAVRKVLVEHRAAAPEHVRQGDIRILGNLDDAGERIQTPQREHVEPIARHLVEELAPKLAAPHFGDIRLGRVAVVRVTRGAQVERDIELDAALRDVRLVLAGFQSRERAQPDRLGHVQPAVEQPRAIRAHHAHRAAIAFDTVALRNALAPDEQFDQLGSIDAGCPRGPLDFIDHEPRSRGGGLAAELRQTLGTVNVRKDRQRAKPRGGKNPVADVRFRVHIVLCQLGSSEKRRRFHFHS